MTNEQTQQIAAIIDGCQSTGELKQAVREINRLIRAKGRALYTPPLFGSSAPAPASVRIGDRVSFQARGRTLNGIVMRINRKTVGVEVVGEGQWRVPPRLLRAPATV